MEKNTILERRTVMKGILNFLLILLLNILLFTGIITAKEYGPVLSGNFNVGDKRYNEVLLEEDDDILTEEIVDRYNYQKFWLKYKQKLSTTDYYYFKGQYYKKRYEERKNYNNISFDFQGNYTYQLTDKLRNRWLLNLRDKEYQKNNNSTYQMIRLNYQLDYKYNQKNKYSLVLQRQLEDYLNDSSKDNIYDKISVNWDYKLREGFTLNSKIQFNREAYKNLSERTNKYGREFGVGFSWEL